LEDQQKKLSNIDMLLSNQTKSVMVELAKRDKTMSYLVSHKFLPYIRALIKRMDKTDEKMMKIEREEAEMDDKMKNMEKDAEVMDDKVMKIEKEEEVMDEIMKNIERDEDY